MFNTKLETIPYTFYIRFSVYIIVYNEYSLPLENKSTYMIKHFYRVGRNGSICCFESAKITLRSYIIRQFHVSLHVSSIPINSESTIVSNNISKFPKTIKSTDQFQDSEFVTSVDNNNEGEVTTIDATNSIVLRKYQQECLDAINHKLAIEKSKRVAISIATGGGKTVVFCMAIPKILQIPRFNDVEMDKNCNGILILVHRRELATQTIKTVQKLKIVDEDRIFLDMGKSSLDYNKTFHDDRPFIIVGSVPTLARSDCFRLQNYRNERFKAVIVDECHHSVSESYLKIFRQMDCTKKSENGPFLLGFTATMARADKAPLKQVFDEIVFQKNISSLIEANHLCDFDWQRVELGLNLDEVDVRGGDFRLESLSEHVNTNEINIIVLKTYLKMVSENPNNFKSLLGFCVSVQHMKDLSQLFRENNVNAQYVSGETKSSERDAIVTDFKTGKIQVLFNCGVFTEGTDIPNIDSIFLLRPTKSKPLLIQMVGRGLRLHKCKEKLIITDFVDSKSVGLTITSTLNGKPDVISLMRGMEHSGFKHRDHSLPGEIEYLKFTNFKSFEMLDEKNNVSQKSFPYMLLKEMKNLNKKEGLNYWTQVKYNTWAIPCGYKSYVKVEIEKDLKYRFSYCFTKVGFKDTTKLIVNKISESEDFQEALSDAKTYINDHEFIKEEVVKYQNKVHNMKNQKMTKAQRTFIFKTVNDIVQRNQTYALDPVKFFEQFSLKLDQMTRWEASEIIFGYTVSRTQSIILWIRNTFLKNKKMRELITKESVLKHRKEKMDDTWF